MSFPEINEAFCVQAVPLPEIHAVSGGLAVTHTAGHFPCFQAAFSQQCYAVLSAYDLWSPLDTTILQPMLSILFSRQFRHSAASSPVQILLS